MNLKELRQLAKTNPEEALLIAWEQEANHCLAEEINDIGVIVKLCRSSNKKVSNWAYRKIRLFDFSKGLQALKQLKDRSDPWESVLLKTLHSVENIKQFKQLAVLISSYDSVWLFSCAERVLKLNFTQAKTKKDLVQVLSFIEYLHELGLKLSSNCYGNQFDFDKYSQWQKRVQTEIFSLIKNSKNELLAIVRDDSQSMKRNFGQQATELLAQM